MFPVKRLVVVCLLAAFPLAAFAAPPEEKAAG